MSVTSIEGLNLSQSRLEGDARNTSFLLDLMAPGGMDIQLLTNKSVPETFVVAEDVDARSAELLAASANCAIIHA